MSEFRFGEARDLGVFVCTHVGRDGLPILRVVHDKDGDWQFLCGGDHSEGEPMLFCLEDMVSRDESVNEVADLCPNHCAKRPSPDAPWELHDYTEDDIRDTVSEGGWYVIIVSEDDECPAFAYSIGLDPELIVFGLDHELMHSMINELGERIRSGQHPCAGERVDGLLDAATCALLRVDRTRYDGHLNYALWFHGGTEFRALQIVWPSKTNGALPWEDGGEVVAKYQPLLGVP